MFAPIFIHLKLELRNLFPALNKESRKLRLPQKNFGGISFGLKHV